MGHERVRLRLRLMDFARAGILGSGWTGEDVSWLFCTPSSWTITSTPAQADLALAGLAPRTHCAAAILT
jgi:hypothetical protein